MKKFIVYAERTTLEKTEVEANSPEEAQKIAFESEEAYWESNTAFGRFFFAYF